MKKRENAVLCHIAFSGTIHTAYFTTLPLKEQDGDGWQKGHFVNNASRPYRPCWHNEPKARAERKGKICRCESCREGWSRKGNPKWAIYELKFEGHFDPPPKELSVNDINSRTTEPWLTVHDNFKIWAGETLSRFVKKVKSTMDGRVYVEI